MHKYTKMRYTEPIYSNRLKKKIKQINKTQARKLYEAGETVYLLPCFCNIDGVWMSLCPINKEHAVWYGQTFDDDVWSFTNYNCCAELGKYPIFFKELN